MHYYLYLLNQIEYELNYQLKKMAKVFKASAVSFVVRHFIRPTAFFLIDNLIHYLIKNCLD